MCSNLKTLSQLVLGFSSFKFVMSPRLGCQHHDCTTCKYEHFVYNFKDFVKLTQHEFYRFDCDLFSKFDNFSFDDFNDLEVLNNDTSPCTSFKNLNGGEDVIHILHSHFMDTSTLSTSRWCYISLTCHHGCFQHDNEQSERWMHRGNLWHYLGTWKLLHGCKHNNKSQSKCKHAKIFMF